MHKIPRPTLTEQIKLSSQYKKNYILAEMNLQKKYGDVFRIKMPFRAVYFFHPKHIKIILKDKAKDFQKSKNYKFIMPFVGKGLVTSEGELWRKQRRIVGSEFHVGAVNRYFEIFLKNTQNLFEEWDEKIQKNSPVNLSNDIARLTLWNVGGALFGIEFKKEIENIGDSLEICLQHALYRLASIIKIPAGAPTPRNLNAKKANQILNQVVLNIIQQGGNGSLNKANALLRLIHAVDEETQTQMDEQQLIDEVKTLVLAGHETTSLAISWSFYLLTLYPNYEKILLDEIREHFNGRTPTLDDLQNLKWCKAFILETMRLYPPVPSISKKSIQELDVDGVRVNPRDTVVIAPYITHRHKEFWEAPEVFLPERFLNGSKAQQDVYAYIPFSAGPRGCLGEHFAMLEAQLTFVLILQKYKIQKLNSKPIQIKPMLTLRMESDFIISLKPHA